MGDYGEVFNRTLGTTGAQHVGVNGTIHKTAGPAEGQIGPSWGGNFSCLDQTRIKIQNIRALVLRSILELPLRVPMRTGSVSAYR